MENHKGNLDGQMEDHNGNLDGQMENHKGNLDGQMENHNGNLDGQMENHNGNLDGQMEDHNGNLDGQMEDHNGNLMDDKWNNLLKFHFRYFTQMGIYVYIYICSNMSKMDTLHFIFVLSLIKNRQVTFTEIIR